MPQNKLISKPCGTMGLHCCHNLTNVSWYAYTKRMRAAALLNSPLVGTTQSHNAGRKCMTTMQQQRRHQKHNPDKDRRRISTYI